VNEVKVIKKTIKFKTCSHLRDKAGQKTKFKSEIHSFEMMDDVSIFLRQNSGMFGLTKPIGNEVTLQSTPKPIPGNIIEFIGLLHMSYSYWLLLITNLYANTEPYIYTIIILKLTNK